MRIELLKVSDYGSLGTGQAFEFLPGKYLGKCGNAGSRFLDEVVVNYFEGIITKRFPPYDHFNFQYLDGPVVLAIASDLKELANTLKTTNDPEMVFKSLADKANAIKAEVLMATIKNEGLESASRKFTSLAEALADWFKEAHSTHGGMSILGL
jgi:hypothetical protein